MKRIFLFLIVGFFLSACASAPVREEAPAEIEKTVCSEPEEPLRLVEVSENSDAEIERFRELGRLYRSIWINETIFDAMVETEKIKRGLVLLQSMIRDGTVRECAAEVSAKAAIDEADQDRVLEFRRSQYECSISDPKKFWQKVVSDPFLSYFKLRNRCGQYWLYKDLSTIATWESWFWYAYFVEKGFEPEIDPQLKLLVVATFTNLKDALEVKDLYPEADFKVDLVICKPYETFTKPKRLELDSEDLKLTPLP